MRFMCRMHVTIERVSHSGYDRKHYAETCYGEGTPGSNLRLGKVRTKGVEEVRLSNRV